MNDARMGRPVHTADLEPAVNAIVRSATGNSGALMSLVGLKDKDAYTFVHSVNVCIPITLFAQTVGIEGDDLIQLGIGALLNDIGKIHIPENILKKTSRLDDAEFEIIRSHPLLGILLLEKMVGIDEHAREIVAHHHERVDGSGFPHQLKRQDIHQLVRVAAIAGVYDALTSDRCYHEGKHATIALREMLDSAAHLDGELLRTFIRSIGIFPVGSLVRMICGTRRKTNRAFQTNHRSCHYPIWRCRRPVAVLRSTVRREPSRREGNRGCPCLLAVPGSDQPGSPACQ